MTDLSTPLSWDASAPAPDLSLVDDEADGAFRWPAPPYASYGPAQALTDPMPCEIVGVNGKHMSGRLTFFLADQAVANVQIPPSRTTLPLRFDQFRCLTLTTPIRPTAAGPSDDPHAGVLAQRSVTPFRLVWAQGQEWNGETVGHAQTPLGVFLFPPADDDPATTGAVRRLFVPASAFRSFELGPRIGEVLIEQHSATRTQIEDAAQAQRVLRDQRLGDILVTRKLVTPEQLLDALAQQARMPMVRIGEALLSMGMVTQAQLDEALLQQREDRSVPLGELLVRQGVVSRVDLQTALARKMGYPLVDVDAFPIEAEALRKLPYAVAAKLQVLPLLLRDGRLIVALDDPVRRRSAIAEVEMHSQMKAAPVLAQSKNFEDLLFNHYDKIGGASGMRVEPDTGLMALLGPEETDKLVETLEREDNDGGTGEDNEKPIEQSDNSLVRLINNMIIEAHREGVSDIHIESYPGKEKIRIRFRKDGMLRTYLELPPNYRAALIARVKIMCDLDISERRKPQDGKINFAKFSPQHKIELRVASIPTNNGLEDVVMRILASAKPIPLDRLGMSEQNLSQLKQAVERPYGMVLCVGPTGSGKTTTLHSALSHINVPERKIWTAEDPVEITQPGLRQVQVNPKIDWTFAKALRAFLRADPDAIMVGEIRDGETAQMAVEASLTGHLVLSTLHTNSAPETVTRLLDMGMDPFNFADSLLAVLAQRLVRRICAGCRESRDASEEETEELLDDYLNAFHHGKPEDAPARADVLAGWVARHGKNGRLQTHRSVGCEKCDGTGFKGRAGLHELMVISRELRRLVQTGARAEALQATALAEGMRTLRQDGIEKVLTGVTSIEEVRSMSNS